MAKLGTDKTSFRDWKVRLKDALGQILKTNAYKEIMEWLEKPTTAIEAGSDMQDMKDNAQNEGVTSPTDKEWEEASNVLKSVLSFKSEDKSEAFLMTKRSVVSCKQVVHDNIRGEYRRQNELHHETTTSKERRRRHDRIGEMGR